MTKYLETKRNSIEEAISSVVKGEGFASDAQRRAAFAQGYKAKGKKDKKEDIDEGYESEVLKVLKDADIDGYFKMGKLYVSRRDAKDAKKALDDSDEITKLPKMVMEDERMKKLTKRQRQALARVQAKPKSQVSLPKMPDFMKLKKEENEMDIVDTIRNVVEKKLDLSLIHI